MPKTPRTGVADISILEWAVYGLAAYASLLMLVISTRDRHSGHPTAAAFLVPGAICAFVLAGSGPNVILETEHAYERAQWLGPSPGPATSTTANGTQTATSSVVYPDAQTPYHARNGTSVTAIPIQGPVWMWFHLLIGLVLAVYVILRMLTLVVVR